jgi:hypothetical protein
MRAALCFCFSLVAAPAWAEWIEIDTGDSIREVYVYVDSAAIRRKGDVFNFWTMWDFTAAQTDLPGAAYRSVKSQQEINCAAGQSRTLTLSYHAEQMALGDVVFTYTFDGSAKEFDRAWKPIAANTFFSEIFKSICRSAK